MPLTKGAGTLLAVMALGLLFPEASLALGPPPSSKVLTVTPTPTRKASMTPTRPPVRRPTATPTPNLTVGSEEEIQVLDAIESQSKEPAASPTVVPAEPPAAPSGLTVMMLKEGVYLSWDPAPSSARVTSYNVYRSTIPGGGYRLINAKTLTAPYYLDGAQNSVEAPKNGENYFYVISALDPEGRESSKSDEAAITPEGMEVAATAEAGKGEATPTPKPEEEERVLNVPEKQIINLQLPADSQLSIQGYKKIEALFSFQKFNRPDLNGVSSSINTTTVNQELVVNLQGKVGKNVDVNVDYSDVNRSGGIDQSKQNISIVYHGNEDSAVQEVAFGDLQLYLPNTEFAGFSKQLFGLQAKLKFDRFHFTSFFAQTKGIAETKVFKGNFVQVDRTIQDVEYIRLKYFRITRESIPVTVGSQVTDNALPQNNSEQIWVDSGSGQINPIGPNFIGSFERYLPGRDYTLEYATGIITFLRSISPSARIAVAFVAKGGTSVGYTGSGTIDLTPGNLQVDPNGIVSDGAHLIKDNINPAAVSPLYLLNAFDLGRDKIVPPQQDPDFLFQVIDQGTNNVLQTGQGGSSSTPWVFDLDQDLNLLTVKNINNNSPPVFFPERPFANNDSAGGTGPNGVYAQTSTPTSLSRVRLRYKTKLDFFRLDRFNIIRGSEAVYLDGRRLRRDVDYFFDYTSGFLDFQDKSILRPDSQIVVTYEYAPFGTFGQSNILGARAEYDVTDRLFLGSTFLYNTTQQPTDVPQVGSTPNSLAVLDADARYDITSEDIQSVTGVIPGLEGWKPPLAIKLSGEVAQSYFNPDTFNAEGETGIAMVDNMEGIDSVVGPNMSATGWLVSSAPLPVAFLGSVAYDGGPDAQNNRTRFFDVNTARTFQSSAAVTVGLPGEGGHVYASTGNPKDAVGVLFFPYSNLTNQRWAGVRQVLSTTGTDFSNVRYFQSWVYNDGVDKWIMFDFGVQNEDSNGNNLLDFDTDSNGLPNQANPNPSYGIPGFYYGGNPYPGTGGSSTVPVSIFSGQENSSQEGVTTLVYVTEDMNGNNTRDPNDSYFEYGVRANWTGWRQVKIPVNFTALPGNSSTPDGISYFFNTEGATPNSQNIRSLRVWTTGTSPAEASGLFALENVSFSRNLWQLQVDPDANANQGVTVNTSKFDVNSISQDQDSRYAGSLRFLTVSSGQDQSAVQLKEKSLKITYNLSSADFEPSGNVGGKPVYYATRIYTQGLDFTDYKDMRFDLQVKTFTPGEVLFIRLGNDQKNYYQYNIPLTTLSQNLWNTMVIPLDGSGGNRQKVGTPFINRTVHLSFGVLSPNAPSPSSGELWINNLRLVTPASRSGLARRVNGALILGDNWATINTRYREVDSGFTQIDQTSTHFQHSRQVGGDYSSSGIKLFDQPLVTQASITRQDLYTEDAYSQNPYYLSLPNTRIDNATGSISYTKELGNGFGRITNVRVSGSANQQADIYQPDYLTQPGVQGNTRKGQENFTDNATYDAPEKLFFLPIGTNQLNQSFSLTHDSQEFDFVTLAPYDRTTRTQTYGWTNTTELVKNLVFTPGYTWSFTDAKGNTNSPGVPGGVPDFTPFQQRYQPKAGLVYRGIPGVIPSVDYTGSNQYDYVSFPDGLRFNNSNSVNYSVNLTPGAWIPLAQRINLTIFGGRTENGSAAIPAYSSARALTFDEQWLTSPPFDTALTASKSIAHQLNSSFRLFDVWDFRPTGSWNEQFTLLSRGTNPVKQNGSTLGITTVYNRRIFTIPVVDFNLNSAQFQYTRTDNVQYDSSTPPNVDTLSNSDLYSLTLPYDISQKAQGNFRFQRTVGYLNSRGTETTQRNDQASFEYNQRFAPNLEIHIPFTKWKIRLQDAIEFKAAFLMEFVKNDSLYVFNQVQTERYRGTIDLNYNALKNLRVGIGVANEYFTNVLNPTLGYSLWQGTISAEARF